MSDAASKREVKLKEVLGNLVAEIQDLIAESEGVAGLHLNGDVAPWDELWGGKYERLSSLDEALDLLEEEMKEEKPGPKVGDVIVVKVGGVPYETVIDKHGTQRFKANGVVDYIADQTRYTSEPSNVDMNGLLEAYGEGKFSQRDYAEYHMMIGYSVSGFCELSPFQDMKVENPLWIEEEQEECCGTGKCYACYLETDTEG